MENWTLPKQTLSFSFSTSVSTQPEAVQVQVESTLTTSNRSEAWSPLDISYRACSNFSSNGFWKILVVGIVTEKVKPVAIKRMILSMYDSYINFGRLNCKEACLYCYCKGNREVTHCRSATGFNRHGIQLTLHTCQTSALPTISVT